MLQLTIHGKEPPFPETTTPADLQVHEALPSESVQCLSCGSVVPIGPHAPMARLDRFRP